MTEAPTGVPSLADLVRAAQLPSVAERKRVREAAKVSLRMIAEACDVSITAAWHWENDKDGPSMENAVRYRKLLEELAAAAGTEIAAAP
jgi:DNA-binding XRE family transcriptional regulator